jgi:hypothetical protein
MLFVEPVKVAVVVFEPAIGNWPVLGVLARQQTCRQPRPGNQGVLE